MAMSDDPFVAKWRTEVNRVAATPVFGDDPTPPKIEEILHLVVRVPAGIPHR